MATPRSGALPENTRPLSGNQITRSTSPDEHKQTPPLFAHKTLLKNHPGTSYVNFLTQFFCFLARRPKLPTFFPALLLPGTWPCPDRNHFFGSALNAYRSMPTVSYLSVFNTASALSKAPTYTTIARADQSTFTLPQNRQPHSNLTY